MKTKIYTGKGLGEDDFFLDLQKENLHTIFLTGHTGSGKSVFHTSMYKQLMQQNLPQELGFVFMDMTQVDFIEWNSSYLYLPTITSVEQSLNALELLANECEYRAEGKSDTKRAIIIHIEECDMAAYDPKRFEKLWIKMAKNKDKSNMYLVFSTSRPSKDIFTETIRESTDLKVLFSVFNKEDGKRILGKYAIEELKPYQKLLFFNNKEVIINPFSKKYLEELN